MLRHALLACFLLAGCGAVYVTPSVRDDASAGMSVAVVPMTAASVSAANRSAYKPRELPAAFFQTAGVSGAARGAGAVPEASIPPETRPGAVPLRLPPPVEPASYRIGVGDVLLLATRQAGSTVEELTGLLAAQNRRQGYTVQDDGAIALPDVGRVVIGGMTLEEAEAEVFTKLVAGGLQPSFSLEIAEFNSKKVAIGGAVKSPGLVALKLTPLTLSSALAQVGGVTSAGDSFSSIRIYRTGALYQVPVTDYLARADLQNLPLLDGDSIFVDTQYDLTRAQAYFAEQIRLAEFRQTARVQQLRELELEVGLKRAALSDQRQSFETRVALNGVARDYVYLAGEVTEQSRFALPFGHKATLADALFQNGGLPTKTGNPSQIYVLRLSGPEGAETVTALHLDARNAVNLVLATKLELRPSDIVFVAEQPVTRWNRVVAQIVPSLLTSGVNAATRP